MSEHLKFKVNNEDSYFAQLAQEQIKDLREKTLKEEDGKYRESHEYHCFRCGTQSLIEIQKGPVSVDICVNENCGALHLDAGELDQLLEDQGFIKKARSSIFDIFK